VVVRMRPERWVSSDLGTADDYAPEEAGPA
jgi:hypothetical protein